MDLFLQPPALVLRGLARATGWLTSVMMMSDADMIRTAGFDAVVMRWLHPH
jgi:hypothetical protein